MLFETVIDIRTKFNQENPNFFGGKLLMHPYSGKQGDALGSIIGSIMGIAIPLSAIAVFLYFVWAGFSWLTAGGDKQKVEDARNRIINAIIGMTIVASALALSYVVNQFFGINVNIPDAGL